MALVAFAVAAVLLVVPVRVPDVQQCGAPGAYLLEGRLDVVPDAAGRIRGPDGEPVTLTREAARIGRERPCRPRVADRAVPAAVLGAGGFVVGLIAFSVELLVVRPRRRRAVAAVRADRPDPIEGADRDGRPDRAHQRDPSDPSDPAPPAGPATGPRG